MSEFQNQYAKILITSLKNGEKLKLSPDTQTMLYYWMLFDNNSFTAAQFFEKIVKLHRFIKHHGDGLDWRQGSPFNGTQFLCIPYIFNCLLEMYLASIPDSYMSLRQYIYTEDGQIAIQKYFEINPDFTLKSRNGFINERFIASSKNKTIIFNEQAQKLEKEQTLLSLDDERIYDCLEFTLCPFPVQTQNSRDQAKVGYVSKTKPIRFTIENDTDTIQMVSLFKNENIPEGVTISNDVPHVEFDKALTELNKFLQETDTIWRVDIIKINANFKDDEHFYLGVKTEDGCGNKTFSPVTFSKPRDQHQPNMMSTDTVFTFDSKQVTISFDIEPKTKLSIDLWTMGND